MRFALRLLAAMLFVTALASAALAQTYTAVLTGTAEVPPNASPATGLASLTLDAAKLLHCHVDFSGLLGSVTASHIHAPAPAGMNAPVRFPFIPPQPPSSPIDIVVGPLTPADEANLNGLLSYVNVHTNLFPGGEIRGQIIRDTVGVQGTTMSVVKALYQ